MHAGLEQLEGEYMMTEFPFPFLELSLRKLQEVYNKKFCLKSFIFKKCTFTFSFQVEQTMQTIFTIKWHGIVHM